MSNPPFPGKVPKMDVIYMTRPQEERTVTEEDCTCNRDPVDGGHTPDCNRMKRNQPCARVSVCCEEADRFTLEGECPCGQPDGVEGYKCKRHGCPWPAEGDCPAAGTENISR